MGLRSGVHMSLSAGRTPKRRPVASSASRSWSCPQTATGFHAAQPVSEMSASRFAVRPQPSMPIAATRPGSVANSVTRFQSSSNAAAKAPGTAAEGAPTA